MGRILLECFLIETEQLEIKSVYIFWMSQYKIRKLMAGNSGAPDGELLFTVFVQQWGHLVEAGDSLDFYRSHLKLGDH